MNCRAWVSIMNYARELDIIQITICLVPNSLWDHCVKTAQYWKSSNFSACKLLLYESVNENVAAWDRNESRVLTYASLLIQAFSMLGSWVLQVFITRTWINLSYMVLIRMCHRINQWTNKHKICMPLPSYQCHMHLWVPEIVGMFKLIL